MVLKKNLNKEFFICGWMSRIEKVNNNNKNKAG